LGTVIDYSHVKNVCSFINTSEKTNTIHICISTICIALTRINYDFLLYQQVIQNGHLLHFYEIIFFGGDIS